jgi:hypothetical protein
MDNKTLDIGRIEQTLAQFAQQQVHLKVTRGIAAVLLLALSLVTFGGVYALKHYDQELKDAEFREMVYRNHESQYQELMEQDFKKIEELSKQQTTIVKVVHVRDEKADEEIAKVMAPKASEEVAKDAERIAGEKPVVLTSGDLSFHPPTIQKLLAAKIDRDRFAADLTDMHKLFDMEQQKTATLTTDLKKSQAQLAEADKVIDGYKHVATKSKFKRFIGGAGKVIVIAVAAYVGYKVGRL